MPKQSRFSAGLHRTRSWVAPQPHKSRRGGGLPVTRAIAAAADRRGVARLRPSRRRPAAAESDSERPGIRHLKRESPLPGRAGTATESRVIIP